MKFVIIAIVFGIGLLILARRISKLLELRKEPPLWLILSFWSIILVLPTLSIFLRFGEFNLVLLLHFLPYSGFLKSALLTQLGAIIILALFTELSIFRIKSKIESNEKNI